MKSECLAARTPVFANAGNGIQKYNSLGYPEFDS